MAKKKPDDIDISLDGDVESTPASQAARRFVTAVQRIMICNDCDEGICKDHWQAWEESKKEVFGS